jgi:hypothetical protein
MANPCSKVRQTCASYLKRRSNHVSIHYGAIPAVASKISQQRLIKWDEEAWHYQAKGFEECIRQERVALYILALDSINFCFWPTTSDDDHGYYYEYEDLAKTLTRIAEKDHEDPNSKTSLSSYALSAECLAKMNLHEMTNLFQTNHPEGTLPPDLALRCQLWNEVGQGLLQNYKGSAWNMIEGKTAVKLVNCLLQFDGFCDYNNNDDVWFLKRAQICVADWNASLALGLEDVDELTTFADYRVPQLLRHLGILTYSDELATKINDLQELDKNSAEEYSIRAATVVAVDAIVSELNKLDPDERHWNAVETDWYLWQLGEKMQHRGQLEPHHRVRTMYY